MRSYRKTILRVNLSKRVAKTERLHEGLIKKYLGGRGLGAKIYYDEVGASVDPLSPDNKLVFATGPLTGAQVFGGCKCSLTTKSPLTGIYLCSNAGGYFGAELKFAGYDALIIEGKADHPVYLSIKDGSVKFVDANRLWGADVFKTQEVVKDEEGKDVEVACIGPSGERLVRFACIMSNNRSFGRGGAGAVMGSKRLKAIAISGSSKVEVAEPDELRELLRASVDKLKETTQNHSLYGTIQYIDVLYALGALPIMHYQKTTHEAVENIFARKMRDEFWVKDIRCFACPVACGKICEVKEGTFKGAKSKPEYETVWALGPNCGVFDYNVILKANEICNTCGVDAITAGYLVGFVMDLYAHKIISAEKIDHIKAEFGSEAAELELLRKICLREGFGDLLAEGSKKVSLALGGKATYYAHHVKGMELTGYEPRAFHGMALAYATSSRGACHNVGGWTIRDELIEKTIDRFAIKGKGRLVKSLQDVRGYIDSLGVCTIPRRALELTDEPKSGLLRCITGTEFTEQLTTVGERVYNLERLILTREGISRKDDDLPPRMKSEPLPDGLAKGRRVSQEMLDEMLEEYYEVRGWSQAGVPKEEKLRELDLLSP